jgi:GAF domain-containing protein
LNTDDEPLKKQAMTAERMVDAERHDHERDRIPGTTDEIVRSTDAVLWEKQEAFITETLAWCADLFRTTRARFIRPLDAGTWIVYTRQRESVVTHAADHAEIAMAYTVGLGRQPLSVTRPRISRADGSGLRPIALTSYLGIPVVCQDRLVGVVEFAGEVRSDFEYALNEALPKLQTAGQRLLFDPMLNARIEVTPETFCTLDAFVWTVDTVSLTSDELRFAAQLIGPTTVSDAASAADMDIDDAVEVARRLAERGLLAVHVM